MNPEYEKNYKKFLSDVSIGKLHGIGMEFTNLSEHIAFQYLMRGYGEYIPDDIDKKLMPKINKIIVRPFCEMEEEDHGNVWLVDVVFYDKSGNQEHFEFHIHTSGHGGSIS